MCGESHSPNSAASLTTPRQSALGFPDVGGGDGQLRNGDSPTATARTSTFTSNSPCLHFEVKAAAKNGKARWV
jgi:hypothetical protein